jgi:hypothetical protein
LASGGKWPKTAKNVVFCGDDNLPVITIHMDTLALLVWAIGTFFNSAIFWYACISMSKGLFSDFWQSLVSVSKSPFALY